MASPAQQTFREPAVIRTPPPASALFDANTVALATFLGTPVVGAAFMAINYRRLGQAGKAMVTIIIAVVVTSLVVLAGWNLPQGVLLPMALVLVFLMKYGAQSLQGAALKAHVEQGGRLGSKGLAAGIALAFAALFVAVAFGILSRQQKAENGASLKIGSKDEVYYAGSASRDEAQALGDALKQSGFFSDRGADVFLARNADGTTLSFIVKEGSWNDPATVELFEISGQQLAPKAGGFPLHVRMMNRERQVKADSVVGKAAFGNDDVFYFGSATEALAQQLGQALKSTNFFQGNGSDVFLLKHSNGTALSFVVSDGVWNNPAAVKGFEQVVRKVAPVVGGLPIKLRLMNTTLETMKEQAVN
jgi:hypothetical protein